MLVKEPVLRTTAASRSATPRPRNALRDPRSLGVLSARSAPPQSQLPSPRMSMVTRVTRATSPEWAVRGARRTSRTPRPARSWRCRRTLTTRTATTRATAESADDGDDARARVWEESFLGAGSSAQRLAPVVTYSSPVEYRYGEGEVTSTSTPSTVVYQQQLAREEFVDVFKTCRARCERLRGYESRVVRFFKPEPSTVLVRWRAEWGGSSGGSSGGGSELLGNLGGTTTVEGQTTYRMRPGSEVICSVEETWDFSSSGSDRVRFLQALGFCMAHAPPGVPGVLPDVFLPAVKLAAWQALKDDPTYGGNLIREELDVITVQAVIAFVALCFSTSLLVLEVLMLAIQGAGART